MKSIKVKKVLMAFLKEERENNDVLPEEIYLRDTHTVDRIIDWAKSKELKKGSEVKVSHFDIPEEGMAGKTMKIHKTWKEDKKLEKGQIIVKYKGLKYTLDRDKYEVL